MSRSKRNYDHLVDEQGNYRLNEGSLTQAFVSFNGNHVEDYWGDYNIKEVVRDSIGVYSIYFTRAFATTQYNVQVSANAGIFRNHHVSAKKSYLVLTITDRDNQHIDDAYLTISAFRVTGSRG